MFYELHCIRYLSFERHQKCDFRFETNGNITDHHFTIQNGCGGVALHLTTLETKTLRNVLGKINDRMFTKNNPKRPKTKIGGEEEQKTNMGIAILTDYFGKRIYQANKLLQRGT